MATCGLTEEHTLEDGTIYILDNRFKTGEEYFTKDGRPVIDCLGRFKGGKNVEKFLKAKVEIKNQDLELKVLKPKEVYPLSSGAIKIVRED